MKKLLFLLLFYLFALFACSQKNENQYPCAVKPSNVPIVFAQGLVSSSEHEFGCSFSPDGKTFYFTRATGKYKKKSILACKYNGQGWSEPEPALPTFEGETYEPHVTPDGNKLFFMGMFFKEGEQKLILDMFYAEKQNGQWTKITHLGEPFNPCKSMFMSTTHEGRIYTTNRSGEGPDIVYADLKQGEYGCYHCPSSSINTELPELYPFVAPDGSYILFNRITAEGKFMYVCFKQEDNSWGDSKKVPLGMESGCPMVSPDGKFLFFSSGKKFLNDIYWVSSEVFLSLKD